MMAESVRSRQVLGRYVIFQVPELVLGSLVLWLLVRLDWISATVGWALFAGWVLKEAALYPVLRRAYEPSPRSAAEALIDRTGCVTARLAPGESGTVRLGAELWRAVLTEGSQPIEVGETVRVELVSGLTLSVVAAPDRA